MADLYFRLKNKDKEKILELMNNKLKNIFNLKKIHFKSKYGKNSLGKIEYKTFQTKRNLIAINIYEQPPDDNILVVCNLSLNEIKKYKEQIIDLIKEIMRSNLVIDAYAMLPKKEKGYLNYSEIIIYPPFEDEDFDKNIIFKELKPDYKEKIGDKYFLRFEFKLKDKSEFPYPHSYLSCHTDITLRYLGTDKEIESGLSVYSKNEDKYYCDRIIIGKLYHGLAIGGMVNDEPDIWKALQKLNELLKKKGKEIVDLEGTYKKILSGLKEYDKK